jgi:Family of unknown function (DUF6499)
MGPDATRWREASAYGYVDDLPADALAWEFLRRNPDYHAHYEAVTKVSVNPETVDDLIRQRWGLRFRDPSGSERGD